MKSTLFIPTLLMCGAGPALAQSLDNSTAANVPAPLVDTGEGSGSGFHGIVAIGGAEAPRYDGAKQYKPMPFGLIDVKYHGVELGVVGTTLKVNFGGDSHFEYGPLFGLSSSRTNSDAVGVIKLLNPISTSENVGAFVGYRFGGNESGQGRLLVSAKFLQDVKSSRGFSFEPSLNYVLIRQERGFVNLDLSTKIDSAKQNRTYFGITDAEAAASGLASYRPGGGLSEVSGGITGGYELSRHWGLVGRVQGGTYVGDASKSPIVKNGSKSFGLFAAGVSYSF
ncbi:MipA/OmpV family protein [Sphingomonas nostoxanthinifaciens]|uniref:MipA/OmpV family protein n=1 Tax=Sphingomonas nostoxanthinifaciens TaxID=2872652 RepID=UPI001CC1CF1B|nr:MipA/OmpV family protein [Sphingomonas nostoxanthinifaciens]UAK25777.1 MipA/OmpV family protein [Sphingomonas nostoxanthinifaciens]